MSYPLSLRFKVLAIAQQIAVRGADGELLMYAKQKAFKLKEAITIYGDEAQSRPLYRIAADRVLDFNATYHISDADGTALGAIRQQGMRSLWRSRYDILRDDRVLFTVKEENPWSKVANELFEGIPLVGMFSGYVFHPRYVVENGAAGPMVRVQKEPAFLETAFRIERLPGTLPPADERLLLIGAIVMILMERNRG